MKKLKIAGCLLFIVVILVRGSEAFFNYNGGTIHLKVNGEKVVLNNNEIALVIDDVISKKGRIKNGKFRFLNCEDGLYACEFKIKADVYGGKTDLLFNFQYFSTFHDWHINDFHINVSITTGNETQVDAGGFVKALDGKYTFGKVSEKITEKEIYLGFDANNL